MSRLMSVAYTEQAVLDRTKSVTRRKGWWTDKRGRRLLEPRDKVTLCRKVMGRKPGEPLVRLIEVEVLDVRRERLERLLWDHEYGREEMIREGFPGMAPRDFIDRYFVAAQGMSVVDEVTRIEWRYHDSECGCRWCLQKRHRDCIFASVDGVDPHPDHRHEECPSTPPLQLGAAGTCATCRSEIVYTVVEEPGYRPRTGWSDQCHRDALVCFRSIDYRHHPDRMPAAAS